MAGWAVELIFGSIPIWTLQWSGCGDVSGSGSGYGYGSGSGAGSGSGDGDGDGYWLTVFKASVLRWSEEPRKRLQECWNKASAIAFWRSDKNGFPSNGGESNEAAAPGVIHKTSGPLSLCHSGTLHATMKPEEWKGERLWVVALFGEIKCEEGKFGALEREIVGEIDLHG